MTAKLLSSLGPGTLGRRMVTGAGIGAAGSVGLTMLRNRQNGRSAMSGAFGSALTGAALGTAGGAFTGRGGMTRFRNFTVDTAQQLFGARMG